MAKRHTHAVGDWHSIATRLDEIIVAHSGGDPFPEAHKLLIAKLAHEKAAPSSPFRPQNKRDLDRLLRAAALRWPGLLEESATTNLSAAALERCVGVLAGAELLRTDLVGLDTIVEHISSRASKGQKGQFFTPRYVVGAIVQMVGLQDRAVVADPACGSGAFLRHALTQNPTCRVFGFDQDQRAVQIAKTMLAASGVAVERAARVDALRRGKGRTIEELMRAKRPAFQGFDAILTNPPFAGDVGDAYSETYTLAGARRVERDVLFIERCVGLLKPGGKLAIVLPHNKVGGKSWAFVRAWLLRHVRVRAVVSLGRNTFMPHTSQKACVLFGTRRPKALERVPRGERVVFFVSEHAGKDSIGNAIYTDDTKTQIKHDLGEAVTAVRDSMTTGGG